MKKSKKVLLVVMCLIVLLITGSFAFGGDRYFNLSNQAYNSDEVVGVIDNNDDDIAYCIMLDEVVVTPDNNR